MSAADLLAAAARVAGNAHAPYSGVRVGAVLEYPDGRTFPGVNVESGSYGLSLCAERSALARAVTDGAEGPVRVAVARADGVPILPCGACRQVLIEAAPALIVVHAGPEGPRERPLGELLPHPFLLEEDA
jgi:cytidine deaminase